MQGSSRGCRPSSEPPSASVISLRAASFLSAPCLSAMPSCAGLDCGCVALQCLDYAPILIPTAVLWVKSNLSPATVCEDLAMCLATEGRVKSLPSSFLQVLPPFHIPHDPVEPALTCPDIPDLGD